MRAYTLSLCSSASAVMLFLQWSALTNKPCTNTTAGALSPPGPDGAAT